MATTDPSPAPDEPSEAGGSALVPIGLSLLGLGVVGVGAGAIMGGMTLAKDSDLSDVCDGQTCPPSARSDVSAAQDLALGSTIAFVVGGAALVAGGTLTLIGLADDGPSEPATAFDVRGGPNGGYATVSGSF